MTSTSSVEFNGQVVVISGAATGIGKASAHLIAARGAKVIALDFNAAALSDLAKELNSTQKIDIFTSRNDIPACLAASDLVVHPSLVDSFSQLLIEVQAVGTAVIATDIAAARQQIIDGVTGLIVKPKDSQELAEAIFRVYKDPELRKSMGIAGFQHVRKQFQVKKMVDEDLMVVQLVLDYK
jgi:glycosyltransferase involved in cell wall biosynthesis